MNLKDWEKLSPEEQQKIWDEARSEVPEEIQNKAKQSPVCDIARLLKEQIEEERQAALNYGQLAVDLEKHTSGSSLSGIVGNISQNELEHHLMLISIVDILNENFQCGGK